MTSFRLASTTLFLLILVPFVFGQGAASETNSESTMDIAALRTRAEKGDSAAQVELGLALAGGNGAAQDEAEALKWFFAAAEKGNRDAEYFVGEMYLTGRGINTSFEEAFRWISKAAGHGQPMAQANLGALYMSGYGVARDPSEAVKWLRKAAEQGIAAGQFGLGSAYENGEGVATDLAQAVKWYRMAAGQDDPAALNNLGLLLATTKDFRFRDSVQGIELCLRAIEVAGEVPAFFDSLATAYFEAGEIDKAIAAEKRAISLNPERASYKKALEKYEATLK